MTDQHQPADAALRLSEARETYIRGYLPQCGPDSDVAALLAELDITRADLARTRAEAAALRAECDEVRNLWLVRLRESMRLRTALEDAETSLENHEECDRGRSPCEHDDDALRIIRAALAAPQSEQPAAPVARSAEAELLALGHQPCCRLLGWLPYMGAYVGGHHPHCKTPITPPDHQAGDGDDPDV